MGEHIGAEIHATVPIKVWNALQQWLKVLRHCLKSSFQTLINSVC